MVAPTAKRRVTWTLFAYVLPQYPLIAVGIIARYIWEGLNLGWITGGHIQSVMEKRVP